MILYCTTCRTTTAWAGHAEPGEPLPMCAACGTLVVDAEPYHRLFRAAYEQLAEDGHCDAPGGMEYRRVRREWTAAGQPADVEAFIRRRANVMPFED